MFRRYQAPTSEPARETVSSDLTLSRATMYSMCWSTHECFNAHPSSAIIIEHVHNHDTTENDGILIPSLPLVCLEFEHLKTPQSELDGYVAAECVLCGDIMVQSVDKPLVTPQEHAEQSHEWAL